ncbi:MAG TPA: 30S ribosomal protein S7 [Bacteroidota bacterium]|nr:30S ribosomal protein S7 [Bacteroidota bacterium]
MRKKRANKVKLELDPKYNDLLVTKFINNLMWKGKKNLARRIFYEAMDIIASRTKTDPIEVFKKALNNVCPVIEVRARRVGGATYQVPTEVRPERKMALGIRWVLTFARQRSDKSMAARLASELIAASNGEGNAIKKKEDTHRMAEANRAFAHYKW